MTKFRLKKEFVNQYRNKKAPFGFNGLGEFTFYRTYSRIKPDGSNEAWFETVERVVNGTYSIQKEHIITNGLPWDEDKAERSAEEMYDRMFNMKFLPPGRGLWAMGSEITEDKGLYAALNNCAFTTTGNINTEFSKPFCFMMDMSMLGVGVGFDTDGADTSCYVNDPRFCSISITFNIPDSREGWVESLKILIDSYLDPTKLAEVRFSYDSIRPAGLPIKGFGGVSSGPEPLKKLHEQIRNILDRRIGDYITSTDIVDIMNMIGVCVISGNVRRTAELAIGNHDDIDFQLLKDYDKNPERSEWGWASNNSIYAEIGMDYSVPAHSTLYNGEPGYIWLENARNYGRMNGRADFKDHRVKGFNPCVEQPLEPYEMCCLVETFPTNHDDEKDYERTIKFAYLYGKTVTLTRTHWPETNRVMLRNRRIGTSMTGVVQAIEKFGINRFQDFCEYGYDTVKYYDDIYSDWLAVPLSVRTNTVKPSGSVSLLAGATPGIHFPQSRTYIRRVRVARNSQLLGPIIASGLVVEDDVYDSSSKVVSFPVRLEENLRTVEEVSMWEQLMLAAFMQRYWSDNAVSVTVTFDPATEGNQIQHALNYFQYQLKAVSFLPRTEKGAYAQMPYESITEERYNELSANLKPIDFSSISGIETQGDRFCDGDYCEI